MCDTEQNLKFIKENKLKLLIATFEYITDTAKNVEQEIEEDNRDLWQQLQLYFKKIIKKLEEIDKIYEEGCDELSKLRGKASSKAEKKMLLEHTTKLLQSLEDRLKSVVGQPIEGMRSLSVADPATTTTRAERTVKYRQGGDNFANNTSIIQKLFHILQKFNETNRFLIRN